MSSLATAGTIAGIAGVLILLVAGLGGQWQTARYRALRDTAEAWEAKSKSQQAQIDDLKAELAEERRKVTDLEGRMAVLQDIVTGRTMLEQIHTEVVGGRDMILARLEELARARSPHPRPA